MKFNIPPFVACDENTAIFDNLTKITSGYKTRMQPIFCLYILEKLIFRKTAFCRVYTKVLSWIDGGCGTVVSCKFDAGD